MDLGAESRDGLAGDAGGAGERVGALRPGQRAGLRLAAQHDERRRVDGRLERVLVEDVLGGVGREVAVAEVDVDA